MDKLIQKYISNGTKWHITLCREWGINPGDIEFEVNHSPTKEGKFTIPPQRFLENFAEELERKGLDYKRLVKTASPVLKDTDYKKLEAFKYMASLINLGCTHSVYSLIMDLNI